MFCNVSIYKNIEVAFYMFAIWVHRTKYSTTSSTHINSVTLSKEWNSLKFFIKSKYVEFSWTNKVSHVVGYMLNYNKYIA